MNPASQLVSLVQELGEPAVFDSTSGGLALWKKEQLQALNLPFERIEIRDEQIPHQSPQPHTDFLYSWYRLSVPKYKVDGLIRINQSISYDPLTKLMQVRCFDLRANVVSHWIVKHYAEDHFTLDEAAGMYGPLVMELLQDDATGSKYQQLLSEL